MLSNDTLKLISILNQYKINFPKIHTNKYFMDIYNNIKNILSLIIINDVKINDIQNNINIYFKDNEFVSSNIKEYILSKLIYGYSIEYENNTIIYYTKQKLIPNKIPLIIINMFKIIKLLKILFHRNDNKQKIIYFETSEKKKICKKNTILGPNEVNSGVTFLNLHNSHINGDIILYRKEELLKVLIHELIHSNLIDSKIILSKNNKKFSNLFCVNYKILLNEAFTESFATIINLFYIHIVSNLHINELDVMFNNELKYSYYICLKIIKYYNITNISDIIKNNNTCINIFPQNTNVFSYYILKNIFLTQHIKFGDIFNKHTINCKIQDESGIVEIIKLIIKNIHLFDKNVNTFNNNIKNNSLRLCLYELKF